MTKRLTTFILLIFTTTISFGQFFKAVLPSPEFTGALEKIVLDFRDDYKSIQGQIIDVEGEMETYQSTVSLPGTEACKILRFHSAQDTTATWQAVVYSGDDYKAAMKAYENTFRLVKKSNLRWIDKSAVNFTGEYIAPRENLRFTTSTLSLNLADPRYEKFEAEIEIQTTYDGWQVLLNLSKRKAF
jgi:hypothetical protein